MKENKYDDKTFFNKYSEMSRSKLGLKGAGEWHELRKLLTDFDGKNVLDLGCGYGWHCKYASDSGAKYVLGIDISSMMLDKAKALNTASNIEYLKSTMEDYSYPIETFDFVISSLAIHYIADYTKLILDVRKTLKIGGKFVFSVEHPVFTAEGSEDWRYSDTGEILDFPVDNYYYEGKRTANFLGEKVTKYHRTLTTYINTLLCNGFSVNAVIEPQPPSDMMDIPGMKDEMRRPMMLIISATKVK